MLSLTSIKSSSTSMRRILSTFLLFLCFATIARAASIPPKGWYDTVLGGTADSGSSYQSGTSWLDTVLAGPSSQPSEASRAPGTVEQAHTTHRTEVPVNSADLAGSSSNQSKAKAPATEAYTYADTPAEDSVTPADAGAEASRTKGEIYGKTLLYLFLVGLQAAKSHCRPHF
ncbi:hypothetical protein C8R42DRAFT_405036 [Lentinula raphanica]|nr:hypothetical protein C8R42DRAFT_405036 [Lentinula raphanica]